MKYFVSAVIPCYNEEDNIAKTLKDADRALNYICKKYEIIVVNDGSSDKTADILKKCASENSNIRVVTHAENKGYGAALSAGLSASSGDIILTVDGDGQFDMREFSYILKGLRYSSIVIGYRIKRKDSFMRRLNSFVFNWSVRLLFGLWVKDINCAMKGFTREVIDTLHIQSKGELIYVDILTQSMRNGFTVVQVPIHHFSRLSGNPTGGAGRVITRSFYEFARLFFREFPLRYKEFTFRQRTTIGFILSVFLLLLASPVFGWHFLVGLCVALLGLALRNWAGGYLHKGKWLACSGPYSFVRHPLYTGSLLLGIGFCMIIINTEHILVSLLLWTTFLGFFLGVYPQKIKDEEKNLKRLYGDEYMEYTQKIPRYFPYRGKYTKNQKTFKFELWKKNTEYNSIIGFLLALIWLLYKMR